MLDIKTTKKYRKSLEKLPRKIQDFAEDRILIFQEDRKNSIKYITHNIQKNIIPLTRPLSHIL